MCRLYVTYFFHICNKNVEATLLSNRIVFVDCTKRTCVICIFKHCKLLSVIIAVYGILFVYLLVMNDASLACGILNDGTA